MSVQIVPRRAPLPRWTSEPDGGWRHRGHHVRSVAHRRDARGRAILAARCCFRCRAILKEWTPCGSPTRAGYPCLRPVARVGAGCGLHGPRTSSAAVLRVLDRRWKGGRR